MPQPQTKTIDWEEEYERGLRLEACAHRADDTRTYLREMEEAHDVLAIAGSMLTADQIQGCKERHDFNMKGGF